MHFNNLCVRFVLVVVEKGALEIDVENQNLISTS